jgi:hypothetical protein
MKMRKLRGPIVMALTTTALAAGCNGASSGASTAKSSVPTPSVTTTQRLYDVGQPVHGPNGVDLTVTQTRVDPPGQYFPAQAANITDSGRWINVQMTVRNGGQQPYGSANFVFDIVVRDQAGHAYNASAPAEGNPGLSAPVLPGETNSGWMRFAVPASGSLRLLWVPAAVEVLLVNS